MAKKIPLIFRIKKDKSLVKNSIKDIKKDKKMVVNKLCNDGIIFLQILPWFHHLEFLIHHSDQFYVPAVLN